MKQLLKTCLTVISVIGLVVGAASLGIVPRGTPLDFFSPESTFIRRWHSALQSCSNLADAKRMAARNKEGGDVVVLNDGSWVAVAMEHAWCTGAGFNATIYVISSGAAYLDPSTCYCGWFPLGYELAGHSKDSQDAFFSAVRASGKTLTQL